VRVLIVTSRLTFVPGNYIRFLETVLANSKHHVVGLALVDNVDIKTVAKIPAMALLGAHGLARTMCRNVLELPLRVREGLCARHGIPVRMVASMNHPETIAWARGLDLDLIVNARTRDIYRGEILSVPRLGCVNIHHGLLPEERGAMCDLHALSEGQPAGFTIHVMTKKLDDGAILLKRVVSEPGERDFLRHIERGSAIEGETLAQLLETIAARGGIPEGSPNWSERVAYRKMRISFRQIYALRRKGIRL
jgi:methionyl-tRNA formyltransferase